MLPLYILAAAIAAYYLYYFSLFRFFVPTYVRLPLPFFGHAPAYLNPANILPSYKLINKPWGIYWVMIGLEPVIAVSHEKYTEVPLTSMKLLKKSITYKPLVPWLGNGLLINTGESWMKRRKLLTPTFHFKVLENYIYHFNAVSKILLEELEREAGNGAFDVYPYIGRYTLDVICESAMGTSVNAQREKNSDYVSAIKTITKTVTDRAFHPVYQYDFFYQFSSMRRKEKDCLRILHDFTTKVIVERKALLEKEGVDLKEDEFGVKKRIAFLDLLLKSTVDGVPLSNEEIREEVDTFMFEGHDTTASALSFALYEIAEYPEVQEKILEEQKSIFGDTWRDITYQDLQEMKYLEQVIKETLRLYPSVPMIAREVTETMQISEDAVLKKGCQVAFAPYVLHRNPEVFEDPEEFKPERFADDVVNKNPFAYIPFSAGPRNCIGQKFAMLELKASLSKIVRHFELSSTSPRHKCILVPETTLKSSNGILIQLKLRNDNESKS